MKKILLIICICAAYASFAQTSDEHFKFMGIPIDGTPQEFGEKLQQKGFEYVATYDKEEHFMYKGYFAGTSCYIGIPSYENPVNSVMILFNIQDSLHQLFHDKLKKDLSEKYGEARVSKVEDGKGITNFSTKNGDILLFMFNGQVSLVYRDISNFKSREDRIKGEL